MAMAHLMAEIYGKKRQSPIPNPQAIKQPNAIAQRAMQDKYLFNTELPISVLIAPQEHSGNGAPIKAALTIALLPEPNV